MEYLIPLLIALFILLVFVTLVGHGIWMALAWFVRELSGRKTETGVSIYSPGEPAKHRCPNCDCVLEIQMKFCGVCGAQRGTLAQQEQLRELAVTLRQLERLHQTGAQDEVDFRALRVKIENERERIFFPHGRAGAANQPSLFVAETRKPQAPRKPAQTEKAVAQPFITPVVFDDRVHDASAPDLGAWSKDSDEVTLAAPVLKPPRKPFAEVLAAFMEQSNVRWGEIIGGLLIIGCSTALVISLWAQISRVPAVKFLIFTTVTAALFGVGFYAEHHWKLPTTSRGILTIATLLVPLNFLAIAAVSTNTAPQGVLVIGSEIIAPALFLCLVYFAGRVITPKWPHLLTAGALGSSVGQLLVRHFAAPEISANALIALGAFPIICYVAASGWMLKIALADGEIDELEAIEIFITLGALTFAVVLPFGLLLYKSGPAGMSMMHLAPVVTLAGMPMLASGMLLWRRVVNRDLAATRTVGLSIAILGSATALAGMVLAWPNPASVVPAALFNFVLFTTVAVALEEPRAHVLAAGCLTLGYLIAFHVFAGHVPWENLRVVSLLRITGSASTGQALTIPFVLFVLVHEWLRPRRQDDAFSYLIAACAVAVTSLLFLSAFGIRIDGDPFHVSTILALYAAGAFWFAWRRKLVGFTWAGAALLFLASAQVCHSLLAVRFPWQSSCLFFAVACTAMGLAVRSFSRRELESTFVSPLHKSAMAGSALAALLLFAQLILFACEPSSVFATRVLILAGVLLGLLILGRSAIFFTGFQMALALGAILLTKFTLQHFNWYGFQPNAWLHPWALQTQGIVLGLMCLAWIVTRAFVGRRAAVQPDQSEGHWIRRIVPLRWHAHLARDFTGGTPVPLYPPITFDQVLSVTLSTEFVMLLILGSASGISRELTNAGRTPRQFDLAGYPHQLIFGVGSLILLVILLAVMFRNFRERRHEAFALGTLVMFWSVCPLVAGRFELQFATASAGRWSVGVFLLITSIAYAYREKVTRAVWQEQVGLSEQAERRKQFTTSRVLLLFITLAPLILLTLSPVVDTINYVPARGPQSGIFRAMSATVLYGLPLMFAVAALAIHAVRERSPGFAFAAGLLTNFTVTVVHIVSVAAVNGPMNRIVLVNSLQLNAIAAASIALLWMATRGWWLTDDRPLHLGQGRGEDLAREPKTIDYSSYLGPKNMENEGAAFTRSFAPHPNPVPKEERTPLSTELVLLTCQKFFAIVLNTLWIVPLTLHLVAFPDRVSHATFAGGSFNGWLALLLTITAVVALDKLFCTPLRVVGLAASLLAIASLSSFGIARFDVARWSGLHVLLGALVLIAWLLLAARDLPRKKPFSSLLATIGLTFDRDWVWDSELFAALVGAMVVLVALRGPFNDPLGAWSSIGALLAMSALATSLNWVTFRRGYLYAAGVLFNLAVSVWLLKYQSGRVTGFSAFVEGNVIALSLAGVLWLYLELRTRRAQPNSKSNRAAAFHNVAALASLLAIGIIVSVRLHDDLSGFYPIFSPLPDLLSIASLAVLMVACLWDREAEYAVAGLYLIGLLSSATVLHHQQMTPRHLIWSLMMAAATQAFLAALVWRARRPVIAWATRLKIPTRLDPAADELGWLLSFNCAVVSLIVAIVFWIDLSFMEWSLRALASFAVITQAATFGLMAQGKRRAMWQRTAVAILLVGLVFLSWSCLPPGTTGTWLNRAVILMTLMFATVALFGFELDKLLEREPDWTRAFRDCIPAITVSGIIALVFILCTEVYYQIEFGVVRVRLLALLTVAVTLAAAVIVCIFFALSPKHDPLSLSDQRRSSYVYVAEVLVVLLFMHIRLTMPWLFHGFFQRYWPLVVLAIAYTGVAISEFFKRRDVPVLARPIERTGAFLPLLPVIGFWIAQSRVEYSTLLFVVGGLYGLLSILRRSFWFGLAAALAGNGGLWYLLHETSEYHFYQHPQLWLIPAAISVLIAAHLNRKEFSESQMAGIRYLCLTTIYASSTADIFINGVASSPWLPLVLAALSVAGVFAGMIFRVRAFLLLGATFLLLSIATMIKYASVNFGWTWLWYVAGIVTGMVIIATFAVFEKKRAEVLRVVDGLKDWKV